MKNKSTFARKAPHGKAWKLPRLRAPTAGEVRAAHGNMLDDKTHYRGKCPLCGGKDHFSVEKKTGYIYCWTCMPSSDNEQSRMIFKEFMRVLELNSLREDAPVEPKVAAPPKPVERPEQPEARETPAKVARFWDDSMRIEGTPVIRYLAGRGITSASECLRFHPTAWHRELPGEYRCMVAQFIDTSTGTVTAVQKTFLDLTDRDDRRQNSGRLKGSAAPVRGSIAGDLWVVAEGVEDALSLVEAGVEGTIWAAGGAPNMKSFQVPDHVRNLLIACDYDQVGIAAAQFLARRIDGPKTKVRILRTTPGCKDWNDMLRAGQMKEIKRKLQPEQTD